MMLADWLAREGMTQSDFAALIGVSAPTVSNLCQGNHWLSRKTALAIERVTNGEVTASDFVHIGPEAAE